MEGKVTYSYIADLLSKEYGNARTFSEDFINQLVAIINDGFAKSDNVEINGLGSFGLSKGEGDKKNITFTAAKNKKTDLEKYALKSRKKGTIFIWAGLFIVVVIILGLVYYLGIHKKESKIEPVPADIFSEVVKSDTLANDTINKLTVSLVDTHLVIKKECLWKIAGIYYPSKLWWPLIYLDNKENIQNPDFIKPNMKILVTKKDKGLDKNDSMKISDIYHEMYLKFKGKNDSLALQFKLMSDCFK